MTDELRALADPLRARIVELLAAEQLCTCHLAELTGARQTNISNHLRVLREAGLVETQPAGRYTYYRLRPEAFSLIAEHYAALADRAHAAAQLRRPCAGTAVLFLPCTVPHRSGRPAAAAARARKTAGGHRI
jgi:ArsR family transcriptional regulator